MTLRVWAGARAEIPEMVELIAREALSYLEGLDERPVRSPEAPGATVGRFRRAG
jgi:hypothetical protein